MGGWVRSQMGLAWMGVGVSGLVFQTVLFKPLVRRLGLRRLLSIGLSIQVANCILLPALGLVLLK